MNYSQINKKLNEIGISDSKFASRIDCINRQIEKLVNDRKELCDNFAIKIHRQIDDSLMMNEEDRMNEKKIVEWVIAEISENFTDESVNPFLQEKNYGEDRRTSPLFWFLHYS